MDADMDLTTLSGAARAPALASTSSIYRAKEPFHVQVIPPSNAYDNNASPAYVTHLLSLSTSYGTPTLLAVADDSTLTLIDKTSGVVAESHRAFEDARITGAKPLRPGSFVASVSNGTVACWDARTGLTKPVWTLQGTSRAPYLCVAPNSNDANVLVAGTEQYGHGDSDIDIWDIRTTAAPKSKYNEVHSDDITVLQYHPDSYNHAGILLSGSTDGLVSAIDTTIAEEDDAVISVGNTGNSVARAGWIAGSSSSTVNAAGAMDTSMDGDADEAADLSQVETEARRRALGRVWAIGDMQTLSLFDADKFDPILATTDVRSSSSLRPPWSTDYVIDAFTSLPSFPNPGTSADDLTLFVGKSEGAFAAITVSTTAPATTNSWGLRAVFPEQGDGTFYGHADIIRSVEWDAANSTLYTGGEDGHLCFWQIDSAGQAATSGSIALPRASLSAAMGANGGDSQSSSRSGSRNATPGRSQRYTPYK